MADSTTMSNATTKNDVRQPVKWSVRLMRFGDIEKCLQIWKEVHLNEGYTTASSQLASDPEGFYVACVDGTDKVIGMCSVTRATVETAFLGFYAVLPEYQGQGIGKALWTKALARMQRTRTNVGLFAVPEMLQKYQDNGFPVVDKYHMLIYENKTLVDSAKLDEVFKNMRRKELAGVWVKHLDTATGDERKELVKKIIEYDDLVFLQSRKELLEKYLLINESDPDWKPPTCVALVKDTKTDKEVVAYACMEPDNFGGALIGPIYANSDTLFQFVLKSLLEKYNPKPAELLSSFVLSYNQEAIDTLESLGFKCNADEKCSRLFTKFTPRGDLTKVYCIFSPNFSFF